MRASQRTWLVRVAACSVIGLFVVMCLWQLLTERMMADRCSREGSKERTAGCGKGEAEEEQ